MRNPRDFVFPLVLMLALCTPYPAAHADDEIDIPVSEVPAPVLAAVRDALPGIQIHSAARLNGETGVLYEIEGDAGDDELEFIVSPDGRIVETERE